MVQIGDLSEVMNFNIFEDYRSADEPEKSKMVVIITYNVVSVNEQVTLEFVCLKLYPTLEPKL